MKILSIQKVCLQVLLAVTFSLILGCNHPSSSSTTSGSTSGTWNDKITGVILELHPDKSFKWYPDPTKGSSTLPPYSGTWSQSSDKITLRTTSFKGKPVMVEPEAQVFVLSIDGTTLTDSVFKMVYHKD